MPSKLKSADEENTYFRVSPGLKVEIIVSTIGVPPLIE